MDSSSTDRRRILDVAVARYREEQASASELAAGTGLAVEEIMRAVGATGQDAALEMFLASCRTIAARSENPEFLRLGEEAVRAVASERI